MFQTFRQQHLGILSADQLDFWTINIVNSIVLYSFLEVGKLKLRRFIQTFFFPTCMPGFFDVYWFSTSWDPWWFEWLVWWIWLSSVARGCAVRRDVELLWPPKASCCGLMVRPKVPKGFSSQLVPWMVSIRSSHGAFAGKRAHDLSLETYCYFLGFMSCPDKKLLV